MKRRHLRSTGALAVCAGITAAVCLAPALLAQKRETITATAKTTEGPAATAPVRLVFDRQSTDKERDDVLAALKSGGNAAVRALLAKQPSIGTVTIGTSNTAIKYVRERTTGEGRLLTIVTGGPIGVEGASLPAIPHREGFDLGMLILQFANTSAGHGELLPATKVRMDDQGGIVTEINGPGMMRLSDVIGR